MTNLDHSSIAQPADPFPKDLLTELAPEFHAWELASDEALENFEKQIDKSE